MDDAPLQAEAEGRRRGAARAWDRLLNALNAADAAGHRWEHLAAVVDMGGADALYALCDALFRDSALARSPGLSWVFAGRLIALRKPGDEPDRRRGGERMI